MPSENGLGFIIVKNPVFRLRIRIDQPPYDGQNEVTMDIFVEVLTSRNHEKRRNPITFYVMEKLHIGPNCWILIRIETSADPKHWRTPFHKVPRYLSSVIMQAQTGAGTKDREVHI